MFPAPPSPLDALADASVPLAGRPRRQAPAAFVRLLGIIAWAAAGVHLLFLALFLALGARTMVQVNGVSLVVFLVAAHLIRTGRWQRGAYLIAAEVLAHAALAVLATGWETGFHLYLLVLVPISFLSRTLGARTQWRVALAVLAYTLALRWVAGQGAPWNEIPPAATLLLQCFNTAMTLLLLAVFSFVYSRLVTQAEQRLAAWAATDALTGLANRRHWLAQAELAQARQLRSPARLAVVLADIDHFKQVNDTHGHDRGDAVLRAVARTLAEAVRESDVVARWGGEEFIVLLHGADLRAALDVAEHLRVQVQNLQIPHTSGGTLNLSMSFGVTELRAAEHVQDAIRRSDQALYEAKHAGRNRVGCCALDGPQA